MKLNRTHKILIGIGSTIVALFFIILLIPVLFEDQIAELVKKEANMRLKAKLEFSDVDISMFRNFPRISVSIKDVSVVGKDEFQADTLLSAGELSVAVNLLSVFSGDFEISKVVVADTRINTIIGKSGAVNWDIVKSEEEMREEGYSPEETEVPITLELEQINIENLSVTYDDRDANMFLALESLDATCSGDITGDITNLKIVGSSPSLSFSMMGLPIMERVSVKAEMDTEIDMAKSRFTFRDNSIVLNAVQTGLDGWVELLDDGFDMDIRLNTEKVGFKQLLSLIPGIYSEDFAKLNSSGKAMLSAYACGVFDDVRVPAFDLLLSVSDASFKYPDLPSGVEDINIAASISNPGGSMDATVINLDPLTLCMAGQSMSLSANIATPVSDLTFDMAIDGRIDLEKLAEACHMGDTQLGGIVMADVALGGKASYLLGNQIDKCVAKGNVDVQNILYAADGIPQVQIPNSTFTFTPSALKLTNTNILVGSSDVQLSASLENYLGYLFAGSTIKGTLNIDSQSINLDELMGSDDSAEQVVEDTPQEAAKSAVTRVESVQVPSNIDFKMNVNLKKVVFGSMPLRNVAGNLIIKDSKIDMSNLSLNMMGGGVVVNGLYSTPSYEDALFKAGINVKSLKFADIAKDLGINSPLMSAITGSISSHFDVNAPLKGTSPDLGMLSASGSLAIKSLGLPEMEMLSLAADLLGDDRLKNPKVEDFAVDFEIKDGVVSTKPIEIMVSGYKVRLEGQAKLDQSINYKGTITAPSGTLAAMGPIPLTIKGSLTKPELTVDMESIAKSAAQQVLSGLSNKLLGSGDSDNDAEDSAKKEVVLPQEVTQTVEKVDSIATTVQTVVENLPTKEEVVEQIKEQLPTKEEVKEEVKEQLKGAAVDFLKGLGSK